MARFRYAHDRDALAEIVTIARRTLRRDHYIVLGLHIEYRYRAGLPPLGLGRCIGGDTLRFLDFRVPAAEPYTRIAHWGKKRVSQVAQPLVFRQREIAAFHDGLTY